MVQNRSTSHGHGGSHAALADFAGEQERAKHIAYGMDVRALVRTGTGVYAPLLLSMSAAPAAPSIAAGFTLKLAKRHRANSHHVTHHTHRCHTPPPLRCHDSRG